MMMMMMIYIYNDTLSPWTTIYILFVKKLAGCHVR